MGGKNMTPEMLEAAKQLHRGTMFCPIVYYLISLGVNTEQAHKISIGDFK